jgi:CubicO group peptidase (beta-lactamase class C family)
VTKDDVELTVFHLRAAHGFRVLLLSLLLIAPISSAVPYQYIAPENTDDGWRTADAAGQKLDVSKLQTMFDHILAGEYKNISSVLVVKDGALVVEEYFPRTEADRRAQAFRRVTPVEITSATKSITSILIGIAIDKKLIRSVDEKISKLLPQYAEVLNDPERSNLCLRHLLTMSAGLSWDEWSYPYTDERNSHIQMLRAADPIRFVLEQKLTGTPGTRFAYSSGVALVLGEIIHKVSGLAVDKFAEKNLFGPLGITDFYWSKYPREILQTGGGLFLRPRDMAKIGLLFLNDGRSRGKQVVSPEWIRESTTNYISPGQIPSAAKADGYGYQWWLSSFDLGGKKIPSYSARGRGGQFILVVPSEQLVAVFTGPPDNPLTFQPLELAERFILPATARSPSE